MSRRRTGCTATVAALLAAPLIAGCAGDAPGDLSAGAAKDLRPQVQHVREVAAIGDYAQLKVAVASLKSIVRQHERDGDVSPSRANAILDAADVLLQDARSELSPTPTPTTESPTPTPTTTTESPTPTPTDTSSPVVSTSIGAHSSGPSGHPKPSKQAPGRSAGNEPSP